MAFSIPDNLTRLQAVTFISNSELTHRDHVAPVRESMKVMAETVLRKLIQDCISTVRDEESAWNTSTKLVLDVYVLTPTELSDLIIKARADGKKDAAVWDQQFLS